MSSVFFILLTGFTIILRDSLLEFNVYYINYISRYDTYGVKRGNVQDLEMMKVSRKIVI